MSSLIKKNLERFAHEPLWIGLAAVGLLGLGIAAGFYVSGVAGVIIALTPIILLLVVLAIVNPYPFWLFYFAIVPFSYIFVDDSSVGGSFVRLGGLAMVVLSIPSILLSKRSAKFKVTPLGASIMIFFLGSILSILAFFEPAGAFRGVGLYFGNVMAYWVFVNIFNSEKHLRTVLNVLISVLTIQAIIAIVQKLTSGPLLRSAGTLNDPNYFGFWLMPFICVAFYMGVSAARKWEKLLYFVAYALLTIAVPLTYSRSMILVLIPTQFVLYWRRRRILLFAVVLAAVGGLLYIGFAGFFSEGLSLKTFFTAARMASIDWRFYFAKTAIRMFLDHPIFGVGADCFYYTFRFYSDITPHIYTPVIHNAYLEILSGTGLMGILPFIAVVFFALRNFWLSRKHHVANEDRKRALLTEGLLIGFSASLLSHLFLSTQHHILLWFFLAVSTIVSNLSWGRKEIESFKS